MDRFRLCVGEGGVGKYLDCGSWGIKTKLSNDTNSFFLCHCYSPRGYGGVDHRTPYYGIKPRFLACIFLHSRLQTAREEAEVVFKDMALGDGVKRYGRNGLPVSLRKSKPTDRRGRRQRETRVEKAQREALELFGQSSLDSLPVRKHQM